jgi:hypothetical protein
MNLKPKNWRDLGITLDQLAGIKIIPPGRITRGGLIGK